MNICVLASTNGTDLQAILDEMKAGRMVGVDLKFVLTDRADCGAVEKARAGGVAQVFLDPRGIDLPPPDRSRGTPSLAGRRLDNKKISRADYDRQIAAICEAYEIDLMVLVGWMRLFGADFVKRFYRQIINVHPSLLPKYPGMDLDVHQAVLDSGVRETGMTIHFVDEGVDTGEIILQKTCAVDAADTVDSLKDKVQALEKRWLPEVIRELAKRQKKPDRPMT